MEADCTAGIRSRSWCSGSGPAGCPSYRLRPGRPEGIPLRGNVQGSDDVHQRGFSAAGFSYNGHKLSLFNGKGDPVAGPHLLVPHLVDLIDVLQLDQRDLSCACVFSMDRTPFLWSGAAAHAAASAAGAASPFRRPCRRVPSSSYPYWCQSQNPDPRRPHLPPESPERICT